MKVFPINRVLNITIKVMQISCYIHTQFFAIVHVHICNITVHLQRKCYPLASS